MTQDDIDLFCRKVMCAMIQRTVEFAKGENLSNYLYDSKSYQQEKLEEQGDAIGYIMGTEFEYDMMLLGLENAVKAIRAEVNTSLDGTPYQAMLTIR